MSAIRRVMALVLCSLVLAGCQEDGTEVSGSETAIPDLLAGERKVCERSGGRWGSAIGKATFVCYHNLSDANKTCSTSRDCQGMCLARSHSCSPIEPFFGCHEVLSSGGVHQTLCIE